MLQLKCFHKYVPALGCLLISSAAFAEESDYTPLGGGYDYIAVKNIRMETLKVLEYGQIIDWQGEGMHAGLELFGLTIFNCKDIPEDIVIPENTFMVVELSDMNGNVVVREQSDLTSIFRKLEFVSSFSSSPSMGFTVLRGGEYKLKAEITPDLFSYETTLTLPDKPGMQIANNSTYVNASLQPKLTLSSGYPYEPVDFAGQKYLHWTLAPADDPDKVIVEKDETFELKSDLPTLAAQSILYLDAGDELLPGRYTCALTSDFAPANYEFTAIVNDTFMPEITLDKSIYTAGESKEAVVTADMNYRYPYVGSKEGYAEPTVTVSATLLEDVITEKYSDAAWADSDMHCTATLKIPLDNVTPDVVKEYEDGKVPLDIVILFNGAQMYTTTLEIPFVTDGAGIDDIMTDGATSRKVRYFNVFGVEVDDSYRGIVVTSDGRKIIR